jgi:methionyl-tRNA formyltransferase
MRIIFLGMPGRFSAPPLAALLARGAEVVAVAVPAPPRSLPIARLPPSPAPAGLLPLAGSAPPNILQLAAARGIPALAIGRPAGREAAAALAELRPDLACVACWPWRLPSALLGLPRHGFLNVHPALLPALRGPEPLFWALRAGDERIGATVHIMDAGLDTGDIVAQGAVDLAAGASWEEVEARAAGLGGDLLAGAVGLLAAGRLPRRPQGPGGSYMPAPQAADFAIETAWPARRAFSFMRGTAAWGRPYPVRLGDADLMLAEAISHDPAGALGQAHRRHGDLIEIQMAPGVLHAKVKGKR